MNNLDDILGSNITEEVVEENKVEENSIEQDDKEPVKETKEQEPDQKILVEHGAFHEEREKRKELQRELAEQKERNKIIEERQSKIMDALAARQQPEEEFIDPISKLENKVNGFEQKLDKNQQQIDADNKALAEEQKLVNKYKGSVDAFTKDAPDFMEARIYLINDKVNELKALDYSDAEIAHEIKLIEKQIVERAYSKEQNPAEIVYKLAKGKGYKKAEKQEQKTVEDIDKGLKASKSLGNGGKVSGSEDTLSNVDFGEMTDEEFNAFFAKLEKQSKRA